MDEGWKKKKQKPQVIKGKKKWLIADREKKKNHN